MALVGTRGCKFFLNVEDAFVLMARVSDKTDPFSVLYQAEVLWRFPGMVAAIASFCVICTGMPWLFLLVLPSSFVAEYIFVNKEFFIKSASAPLRILGSVYSALTGYGLLLGGLLWFSYYEMGWIGVAAYLLSNIMRIIIDSRRHLRNDAVLITRGTPYLMYDSLCFLVAFKRIALKYGRDPSWSISQENDNALKALQLLEQFRNEHPNVSARFGTDEGFVLPHCR